jgi:hypothetical protein
VWALALSLSLSLTLAPPTATQAEGVGVSVVTYGALLDVCVRAQDTDAAVRLPLNFKGPH